MLPGDLSVIPATLACLILETSPAAEEIKPEEDPIGAVTLRLTA